MEIGIIYVIPIVAIGLALLGWVVADRLSGGKTERKLERDKESADKLAVAISEQSAGIEKDKELTQRIRECESGIAECIGEQTKIVEEARKRSRTTVELADECLSILEEAEKTEE